VRKGGDRVRITAQLIEARPARISGPTISTDRSQTSSISRTRWRERRRGHRAGAASRRAVRSVNRPTTDLTAYDLYLRAYAVAISSASRFPEALALMTQAIARDPNYGPALGYAAICHFRAVTDCWSKNPEADTSQAIDYARRAPHLRRRRSKRDRPCRHRARLFRRRHRQHDRVGRSRGCAEPELRAGLVLSGGLRIWAGELDAGIERIEAALRLSPRTRVGYANGLIGFAHVVGGRFVEALPKLLLTIQEDPPRTPIAVLPCAMPLWGGWTRRGKSSLSCAAATLPPR